MINNELQPLPFLLEQLTVGESVPLSPEYNQFCADYFNESEFRHVYEIIRDGFPCRLYFDLEFPILLNPSADGDVLTKKWIQLVVDKIYSLHKDVIAQHQVVVLDSCTPEKFSKHVIIRLFGHSTSPINKSEHLELLLPDNLEIGYIMNLLLMDITSSHEYTSASFNPVPTVATESRENIDTESSTASSVPHIVFEVQGRRRTPLPEHLDLFLLNKDGTRRVCFVDLGVYTRNRAFRLFYSSKYGKKTRLVVSSRDLQSYQMKLSSTTNTANLSAVKRDWLSQSFVIPYDLFNGPARKKLVEEDDNRDKKRRKQDSEAAPCESYANSTSSPPPPPAAAAAAVNENITDSCSVSYLTSINADKYQVLPSLNPEGRNISGLVAKDRSHRSYHNSNGSGGGGEWRSNEIARSSHSRDPSWFPALDEYITQHCASVGGVKGQLNGWSLTATTTARSNSGGEDSTASEGSSFTIYKLKYQVLYNRYCGNIQRQHKSNGIMLEVDLIQKSVTQSCWDADCRGYRSPPVYVPEQLVPDVSELQAMVLDYQINQAIKQKPHEWQALL